MSFQLEIPPERQGSQFFPAKKKHSFEVDSYKNNFLERCYAQQKRINEILSDNNGFKRFFQWNNSSHRRKCKR